MWTKFSLCNRVCGNGNYTRTRLCDSPENKHGGKPCPGPDTDDLEECNVEPCPRNAFICLFFKITMYQNSLKSGFFCSLFSHIRTEYGDLFCKSPVFSVNMGKYGPEKTPNSDTFEEE